MTEIRNQDIEELLAELQEEYGTDSTAKENLQVVEAEQATRRSDPLPQKPPCAAKTPVVRQGISEYWLWGLAYLPFLIGASWLVFVVEGEWRLWAAGAVWCSGWFLGFRILRRKGYAKELNKLEGWGSGSQGCGEVLLIVLAILGPFVLLAALLSAERHPAPENVKVVAKPRRPRVQPGEAAQRVTHKAKRRRHDPLEAELYHAFVHLRTEAEIAAMSLEELTRAVAYSRSTGTKVSERLRHLPMSDEEIARDILDYAQKSQCTSETAATGN